jgi:hypothetical protein
VPSRKRTLKAQDVFEKTHFVFGKKVPFKEAFPAIVSLSVEGEETGDGLLDEARHFSYDIENLPGEYINCSNPSCYNGGFRIGATIREMMETGVAAKEESRICQGREGSPKGRKIGRHCMNHFKVAVSIGVKEQGMTP